MRSLLNFLGAAWAERSAREQILLGSLSLVIGFLALWYLVAAPLVEFRNTSRAAYTDSVERYRELSVGIARYQALLSEEADARPLITAHCGPLFQSEPPRWNCHFRAWCRMRRDA